MSRQTDKAPAAPPQVIEACHALTAAMLDAAVSADWTAVMSLEDQRRRCIDELEPGRVDDAGLQPTLETLRALVDSDRRLNELAREARQSALEELRHVRGKAKASARYHDLAARG